ncbi:MAG: Calx-beta domain-containing protein, partial [Mycobacterium sp.]
AAFTVSLSKASALPVSVSYKTDPGTATAGSDYTSASGTVSFAAGETSKTVNVTVAGDAAVENDETFTVALSAPVNAALGTATATGTIRNDDTVVSIADALVVEGNSGSKSAAFTISLAKASAAPVTVKYATANGTATAGSDYTAANGTVSFAAGETSKTVNVAVAGDTAVENDETFTVSLSGPSGATLGDASATGTIRNDDTSVSIADATVIEWNSGSKAAAFTVSLSKALASPVTVKYATTNGTATAGSDFTATGGSVTFAAGVTSQTVNVKVLGDTAVENDETFTVALSAPSGATLGDASATGTIRNDDTVVSIANATVSEGNAGTKPAGFTVSLSKASAVPVTVKYATANGAAMAGSDYTAASGTVSFAAGETSKTVNVSVLGDATVESDETFTVGLSAPTNAALGTATATGRITNDDGPAISIGNARVTEGNSGSKSAVFTVSLSKASATPVSVKYATANGTATAGSDYTAASGTVSFAAGVTSQTVNVTVLGDTAPESDETFTVNLSAPTNGYLGTATGTGTIVNDEASRPPVISATTVGAPDVDTGAVSGTLTATDPDGNTLTYSASTTAKGGTVNINAKTGQFVYIPSLASRRNAYTAYAPSTIAVGLNSIMDAAVSGNRAYLNTMDTGQYATTVVVVDTATKTVAATVPVTNATALAVAGTRLYVNQANDQDGTASLTVRSAANPATVEKTIGFAGLYPGGLAVSADGSRAFVGTYAYNDSGPAGSVQVVTVANSTTTSVAVAGMPSRIVASANGRWVYVKSEDPQAGVSRLQVIDTASANKVSAVPITGTPMIMAVSPDNTRAYVGLTDTATGRAAVQIIDTATNAKLGSVALPSAFVTGVLVSADGSRVYASTYDVAADEGGVMIIDTAKKSLITSIPVAGPTSVGGFSADGTKVLFGTFDQATQKSTVRSFTVNPAPQAATDTFTITVSDGQGGTVTTKITVAIGPTLS